MKKSKIVINKLMTLILSALILLFLNNCQDFSDEEMVTVDPDFSEERIPWNELLNQLDPESEIAFVQNGESIQEAIDGSQPGDIVFIEPGTYQENLSNNKSDVKVIGISLSPNDLDISDIKDIDIDILKMYNQKSIDDFKMKSQNLIKRSGISDFSRTELGNGIAHYQFKVRMGPGEFDVVGIHRIVHESRPYHPVPTKANVFMVHGAFIGFEGTFLANGIEISDINANTSSPFYLASKNVDVWGIDMGWTMVPNSTKEFSFMEHWGYEKDARHTLKAMKIARLIRGFSGQGFSALNILGFSSGNTTALAAANLETQKPSKLKRHIKGIITVDNAFKVPEGDSGCVSALLVATDIADGIYENTNGQFFQTLGYLALNHPDDISPIIDDGSTTNIQAFRLIFARDIFGFGMHFFGGDFNGLFYSDETRAIRAVSGYSHYMPNLLWQEIDQVNCASMGGVTFDDYLNLITVPIYTISAGGGAADAAFYTGSLTASTDITNYLVSQHAESSEDFGHVDNWTGHNAGQLVWSKLHSWIKSHR